MRKKNRGHRLGVGRSRHIENQTRIWAETRLVGPLLVITLARGAVFLKTKYPEKAQKKTGGRITMRARAARSAPIARGTADWPHRALVGGGGAPRRPRPQRPAARGVSRAKAEEGEGGREKGGGARDERRRDERERKREGRGRERRPVRRVAPPAAGCAAWQPAPPPLLPMPPPPSPRERHRRPRWPRSRTSRSTLGTQRGRSRGRWRDAPRPSRCSSSSSQSLRNSRNSRLARPTSNPALPLLS